MLEEIFFVSTHTVRIVTFAVVPIYLFYKDRERLPTYILSLMVILLVTYGLKYGVGAPRPEAAAWEMITPRFPSGHTSLAFAPVLFIGPWKYKLPLIIYAFVVAYSRIFFDLHIPLDIATSIVIALSISALALKWEKEIGEVAEKVVDRF